MPKTGEIKARMNSIGQIQKVTKAMKVVSASKLKRARDQLTEVTPFFEDIEEVLIEILSHSAEIVNPVFDKRAGKDPEERTSAILVMTGDKGLSGGYDSNVCKRVEQLIKEQPNGNVEVLICGRMGREYFRKTPYKVDEDYIYPLREPTLIRAREMGEVLWDRFKEERYDDVYIVYTKMKSALSLEPTVMKLLPMDISDFRERLAITEMKPADDMMKFEPSPEAVFNVIIKKYMTWVTYNCLVQAYTSEQSARMTAMESATDNAEEMLEKLNLDYNRARQAAITQEITEIIGGASAL
ncbi:MAG: ATP synthase F1 subunit gamma [Clostridia bacterium]|nr:ATP synthase F1 subunit gamma [Clostridia bacterium]